MNCKKNLRQLFLNALKKNSAFIATLLFFEMNAQTVQWAHSGISPGYEYGNSITADDSGNIYVSGQIEYTSHFDNGQALSSAGIHDIFTGKYAPDGTVKWLRSAGGPSGDVGYGVAVDAAHNCYSTGEIEETARFSTAISLTSHGGNDIFVSKYGINGQLIWAKSFGSTESDKGYSIVATPAGDILVTGFYSAHIYFDNIHLTPAGLADVYTLKLNTNGVVQWVKKGTGAENDRGKAITYDNNGNIYVAGLFTDQASFEGNTITNNGTTGGFLVKYDSNGQLQWIKGNCCGTSEYDAIATDANGNIYTAGYFTGTVTIGNTTLTSAGNSDVLIVKYNPSGTVLWAKKAGGSAEDMANAITLDRNNNMFYITGQIDDHGYFDSHYIGAAGNRDVFIAAYDLNGNNQWVRPYGGTQRDIGYGITNDRNGNVYTTGIYTGSGTFGNYYLPGDLLSDFYVEKVSPVSVSPPTVSASNLTLNAANCTQMNLHVTPGSGDARIIIAHAGSPVHQFPLNGNTYTASNIFGSGDNLGSGNYVVYNGTGNSVTVGGLTQGVTYYFAVFEYNGTGAYTAYLLNNPAVSSMSNGPYAVNIQASSNSLCEGDTITLTASGGSTYNWTPSNGLSSASGSSVNAFPSASSTYTVTSASNGCQVQNTVSITVHHLPVVTFTSNDSVCVNESPVTLTGGFPAGGIYHGAGVTGVLFDPSVSGVGSIPVSYTYTDLNGCSNSASSTTTVLAAPVVTLWLNNSLCENVSPVVLTGGQPAGGTYSGAGVVAGTFDPSLTGPGVVPVTYSFTNANGCYNSASSSVTVFSAPSVSLILNNSFCENESPVVLTGGQPAGGTYSGQGVAGGTFDPSLSGTGIIPVSYSFTNANGCSNTAAASVTVFMAPSVSLILNNSICENGSPLALTGGQPAGGTYSGQGVVGGTFDPSLSGPGLIPVSYSFTDGNGCTSVATQQMSVLTAPQISIGNDTTICEYNTIALNAPNGFVSYEWSTGSTQTSIVVDSSGTDTGTTRVYLTVEDNAGCSATDTVQITFSICASVEAANENKPVHIFPNPFSGSVQISTQVDADIYVFDITGKLVEYIKASGGEQRFGENYATGVYSVLIIQKKVKTVVRLLKD